MTDSGRDTRWNDPGGLPPSALAEWSALERRLGERTPVVFLDYDGTLTPIVPTPDAAVLGDRMRGVVRRLSQRHTTVVVSGRGREDVARLVDLPGLIYAGSHGFDIAGSTPTKSGGEGGRKAIRHSVAPGLTPLIQEVTGRLQAELSGIEGVLVEPKGVTVAVHYRLADPGETARVEDALDRITASTPGLRKALGKKVFELRPDLDWDKGRAVLWILDALGMSGESHVPIYLGDDTTDEDAFRAVRAIGVGIVVADEPRATEARFSLRNVDEVGSFLERVATI
ncbi:MAG: trehalose-phosphatase [Gemmatimonadota bacterium]